MKKPPAALEWVLVLGDEGEARTEATLSLCQRLKDRGLRCGGFLQARGRDEAGRPQQVLVRVGAPERVPLAVRGRAPRGPEESDYCNYAVADEGFECALRWLREDAANREVLVLGDLGRMEAAGRGHGPSLDLALASGRPLVLAVQESQLFWLLERYAIETEPAATLSTGTGEQEMAEAAEALVRAARALRR